MIENKAEHKHEDKHHHYLRREFQGAASIADVAPFFSIRHLT